MKILWFYNDEIGSFIIEERKNDKEEFHLYLYTDLEELK